MKNIPENPDIVIDSILTTKATGSIQNIDEELQLPDGKSLAELLDDQEKQESKKDIS